MVNSRIIWKAIYGLLAVGAYITADAALAAAPVANEIHSWKIPAEAAPAAVRDFGLQSGVAISAEQTSIEDKRLNAVTGSLTVDEALRQLVEGTGVTYLYDPSGHAVTLTAANSARTEPANARRNPPTHSSGVKTPFLGAEIVVTARKRAENLQDVPVTADVISGETLARLNLNSLTDIAETIPSIHINGTGAGGQFFIRGIGSGTNQSFAQSVGTFVDDIYHGRTRIAGETFLDMDRVEVLEGPQSTYFGNNTVAGAFNIVTARPMTDTFSGSVRAVYGQYGQYTGEGALNVPLGEEFAVRIAAIGDGLNGWQSNPFADHDQPDRNNKAGRVTFLYRPTDDFDATLKIEGGENHDSDGSQIGDCPPPPPFVAVGFCADTLKAGYPTGLTNRENTTDAGQGVDLSTFEDVLTLHYHLGNQTLTSVTGFYNYHFKQDVDADGTPEQLFTIQFTEKYHQVSQELRIASPSDQTLEYLGGVYFQNDGLNLHGGDLDYFFLTPSIEALAKTNDPALAALLPYLPLAATVGNNGIYAQEEHSYAAFGSLGWNVTEQWKLSSGVRGSWVYKSASQDELYGTATQVYGGIVPLPANLQSLAATVLGAQTPAWSASESSHAVMPSAQVEYRLDPAAMLYFSYSRGFLAGVPTAGVTSGIVTPPVKAEYVNDFEAGFKSEWLGGGLRLDFDIFRSNYTNLQVSSAIFNAVGAAVPEETNAGRARTQGVELKGEWVAAQSFRLRVGVNYLDARYVSYPNVSLSAIQSFCRMYPTNAACEQQFPAGVPILQNLSGDPTNFAPTWSGTVSAIYTQTLPGGYRFTTEADVYGSTSYFFGNNGTDDAELLQAGYARLDSRLSLESPNAHWAIGVLLKNLTDKLIVEGGTGGTSLPTSTGSTLIQTEQRRSVAVQAQYKW